MEAPRVIYLAGQISVMAPETYYWRERFTSRLAEDKRFSIINPCGNKFNENSLKKQEIDSHFKLYKANNIELIVPKDRASVKRSDICVVNMIQYDETKPLLGTIFELAWYFDSPEKIVIGITDDAPVGSSILSGHPFIKATVHTWVSEVYEAADLVQTFTELE